MMDFVIQIKAFYVQMKHVDFETRSRLYTSTSFTDRRELSFPFSVT